MSTKSLLHQAKLNEWASRFADQKASGLSVTEWCRLNHFNRDQFFYWKRLLKDEAVTQMLPEIVPLAMPASPSVPLPDPTPNPTTRPTCTSCATFTPNPTARVFINGITIEIDSNASETFIKNLIKAVRHV